MGSTGLGSRGKTICDAPLSHRHVPPGLFDCPAPVVHSHVPATPPLTSSISWRSKVSICCSFIATSACGCIESILDYKDTNQILIYQIFFKIFSQLSISFDTYARFLQCGKVDFTTDRLILLFCSVHKS